MATTPDELLVSRAMATVEPFVTSHSIRAVTMMHRHRPD